MGNLFPNTKVFVFEAQKLPVWARLYQEYLETNLSKIASFLETLQWLRNTTFENLQQRIYTIITVDGAMEKLRLSNDHI